MGELRSNRLRRPGGFSHDGDCSRSGPPQKGSLRGLLLVANRDRRVTTSALWQREPAATQFLLKYQNTAGGVALAAVVYGVECRVVWREPAVAASVSRVSQR